MNWVDKHRALNPDCPEVSPAFTEEQLDRLKHAIQHSIITNAHAFYSYLQNRTHVSPHTQHLFDSYRGEGPDWDRMRELLKYQDVNSFTSNLEDFTLDLVQDARIELRNTNKDTYSLLLPLTPITKTSGKKSAFYKACLELFCHTRLAEAEDRMPVDLRLMGEGKRSHLPLKGNPSLHLEFETGNSLYSFVRLLGPIEKENTLQTAAVQTTRH